MEALQYNPEKIQEAIVCIFFGKTATDSPELVSATKEIYRKAIAFFEANHLEVNASNLQKYKNEIDTFEIKKPLQTEIIAENNNKSESKNYKILKITLISVLACIAIVGGIWAIKKFKD